MKMLSSFLRLIRFPNLAFIVLTQCLFFFGVIVRLRLAFPDADHPVNNISFLMILAASFLIAAGGYVINDYFDINIDSINKPDRQVVERVIKRRWAMVWHVIFSASGLSLSIMVSSRLGNPLPGLFNGIAILLLWFYSTDFKRKLLIGNIVISLLTAWVVLILYVAESGLHLTEIPAVQAAYITGIYKSAIVYGGFAFITSLIREAVKDLEDMQGDARYDCRTMPIVWGVRSTKIFIGVWLIVLIGALSSLCLYFIINGKWGLPTFLGLTVAIPAGIVLFLLRHANTPADYHRVSRHVKFLMLFGSLSMMLH